MAITNDDFLSLPDYAKVPSRRVTPDRIVRPALDQLIGQDMYVGSHPRQRPALAPLRIAHPGRLEGRAPQRRFAVHQLHCPRGLPAGLHRILTVLPFPSLPLARRKPWLGEGKLSGFSEPPRMGSCISLVGQQNVFRSRLARSPGHLLRHPCRVVLQESKRVQSGPQIGGIEVFRLRLLGCGQRFDTESANQPHFQRWPQ